ncbi:MAG: sensor histidine kinase [Myxococcaceae bacterium]
MGAANFIYGLSFVVIGVAILAQPRQQSRFGISRLLPLFAAYSLLHAPGDFLAAWIGVMADLWRIGFVGDLLAFASYAFLFEFGRRLLGLSGKTLPWWSLPLLFAGCLGASALSSERFATLHVLVGYLVRVPAGILSGAGLLVYYRSQRTSLEPLAVRKYFVTAAVALFTWTFFCGVVRARAGFFPANLLNVESFRQFTGVPVELFRAACGLTAAWAMAGMLRMFHWEAVLRDNLDRSKDELLATVSHELKTPLTAISLALARIETLAAGARPERAVELAGIARANVNRLGRLVNDVLDLESLRAGGLKLHLEPLDPGALIENGISGMREIAVQSRVELVADKQVSGPSVLADRDSLLRVLANLISNAIRFTTPGGTVSVRASAKTDFVRFAVVDQGPGIAADHIPLLFHRFKQLDPADARSRGGNGLGLAISRALIEQLGGSIGVESHPGQGAVFFFDVPRAAPAGLPNA